MTCGGGRIISIHALLAESDVIGDVMGKALADFYPRSPCGERPVQHPQINKLNDFYPRSPCGERLGLSYFYIIKITISIHALLAESDTDAINGCNPDLISIHALLAESDRTNLDKFHKDLTFLSTLSLRRATGNPRKKP